MKTMTVDGLLDASFVVMGNAITLLTIRITIMSGYQVLAYIAGSIEAAHRG